MLTVETIDIAAGVIVAVGSIAALLAGYHKWYARKAIQSDDIDRIVRWFTEPTVDEPDRETLPSMLRSVRDAQEAFGKRLDQHLLDEEAKIEELTREIEAIRRDHARP